MAETTSAAAKDEIVDRALRRLLTALSDEDVRVDHVDLRLTGVNRVTGQPVEVHVVQDNDPAWSDGTHR